jgi:iron complex outermembrane receptor protein
VTAYELGFKTAQSWVRFQSAVYYYDYKNLQVSLVVPIPGCATCGAALLLQNAPKAKIYGWDNEVTLTPVEHLTLHAGVTWLHGRYGSFPNATGTGVNATNTLNVTNQTQDWTHKRLVRAPDFSGNASIDYEIPLSYGSLMLSGSMNFTSSFPISNASLYGPLAPPELREKQRLVQDSYAIFNASARWTSPGDRYSVMVYGNNLTNKSYRMSYNASAFGDYSAKAEPITYGVKLGVKF